MLLTVTMTLEKRGVSLLIPEEALVPEGEEQFVFVINNGRAVKRKIVIGERRPGTVEVHEGLGQNERVIVGGIQRLRDGVPVREAQPINPQQGS